MPTLEHRGSNLRISLKALPKEHNEYAGSYRGIELKPTKYKLEYKGVGAGGVSIAHGVKLPEGKADVMTNFVADAEEGVGLPVLKHFLDNAREKGMRTFVIKTVLPEENYQQILDKIEGINWETISEGKINHIVVKL